MREILGPFCHGAKHNVIETFFNCNVIAGMIPCKNYKNGKTLCVFVNTSLKISFKKFKNVFMYVYVIMVTFKL